MRHRVLLRPLNQLPLKDLKGHRKLNPIKRVKEKKRRRERERKKLRGQATKRQRRIEFCASLCPAWEGRSISREVEEPLITRSLLLLQQGHPSCPSSFSFSLSPSLYNAHRLISSFTFIAFQSTRHRKQLSLSLSSSLFSVFSLSPFLSLLLFLLFFFFSSSDSRLLSLTRSRIAQQRERKNK